VLITHEHPDHYFPEHLARTDAPVLTIEAVAKRIREEAPDVAERLTVVSPGSRSRPRGSRYARSVSCTR
jgi:L-ascorbate metabolism protein UlaG (beta-lactamase superfamily)